jgi:hypothetical protein
MNWMWAVRENKEQMSMTSSLKHKKLPTDAFKGNYTNTRKEV